jgi:hypothetical protein
MQLRTRTLTTTALGAPHLPSFGRSGIFNLAIPFCNRSAVILLIALSLSATALAGCIPIGEAAQKVGGTVCVAAKVLSVGESRSGNFYLDFCEHYSSCPFTVFVPRRSLRDVGDVRQLEGKLIEIHGKVQLYGGRAEIVLKDIRQLRGEAAKIPPVPRQFDVTRRGSFSARAPHQGVNKKKAARNKVKLDGTMDVPNDSE